MTPATIAVVMALNLFLGTTYFATKKAVEGLPEFSVVLVRSATAICVLAPLAGTAALRRLFTDRRGRGALLAMGGLGLALPLVLGNYGVARHPPLAVTAGALGVSLPLLLPFAAMEWPRLLPGAPALRSLGWSVALGLFASGAGAALWNLALQRLAASQVAGFVFLQPLAGVALGVAFLDEPLTRWAVAGGTLVFAGVYALVLEARRFAT